MAAKPADTPSRESVPERPKTPARGTAEDPSSLPPTPLLSPLLARRLGYRFALVLSGSTHDPTGADPPPDVVAADLAAVVDQLLA